MWEHLGSLEIVSNVIGGFKMVSEVINTICQVLVVLLGGVISFTSYRFGNLMFAVGRVPGIVVGVGLTVLGLVGLFGIL